jgi:hypothetical protein
VTDISWITFNPTTLVVSWIQPNPLFDGNYTIQIKGTITNLYGA